MKYYKKLLTLTVADTSKDQSELMHLICDLFNLKGDALSEMKQYDEAEKCYRNNIKLNKMFRPLYKENGFFNSAMGEVLYRLGMNFVKQSFYNKALSILNKSVAFFNDNSQNFSVQDYKSIAHVWLLISECQFKSGRKRNCEALNAARMSVDKYVMPEEKTLGQMVCTKI